VITQSNGRDHSRSPILVPSERP